MVTKLSRTTRNRARSLAAGLGALAVMMVPATAQAAPTTPPPTEAKGNGVIAQFDGKKINLKDGWGRAEACVVFSRTDTRCYDTAAEADRVLGYSKATDPLVRKAKSTAAAAAIPACANSYLCLYEHRDGGGRRLIFRDEYWQGLYDYDFDNQMSSWRNNQPAGDDAYVYDDISGLQLRLSDRAYSSFVGAYWNDHADQVIA